ncbi:hypothetical protein CVT25_003360 [Psilocybe cyanescens]|uniref:Uncharacterized protein n=1 Tax=Psilocybe cyanescens TaxID=93625 RepID=A0A409XQN7_PSICY|nr:hypothetical protein CVT25_003360 [Psilocybe cyanescens]
MNKSIEYKRKREGGIRPPPAAFRRGVLNLVVEDAIFHQSDNTALIIPHRLLGLELNDTVSESTMNTAWRVVWLVLLFLYGTECTGLVWFEFSISSSIVSYIEGRETYDLEYQR